MQKLTRSEAKMSAGFRKIQQVESTIFDFSRVIGPSLKTLSGVKIIDSEIARFLFDGREVSETAVANCREALLAAHRTVVIHDAIMAEYKMTSDKYFELFIEPAMGQLCEDLAKRKGDARKIKRHLEDLKETGMNMSILSNGHPAYVGLALDVFKLRPIFDHVITSLDLNGDTKPFHMAFRKAGEITGYALEKTAFVDNSRHNLYPPHKLGMPTVYVGEKSIRYLEYVDLAFRTSELAIKRFVEIRRDNSSAETQGKLKLDTQVFQ